MSLTFYRTSWKLSKIYINECQTRNHPQKILFFCLFIFAFHSWLASISPCGVLGFCVTSCNFVLQLVNIYVNYYVPSFFSPPTNRSLAVFKSTAACLITSLHVFFHWKTGFARPMATRVSVTFCSPSSGNNLAAGRPPERTGIPVRFLGLTTVR